MGPKVLCVLKLGRKDKMYVCVHFQDQSNYKWKQCREQYSSLNSVSVAMLTPKFVETKLHLKLR